MSVAPTANEFRYIEGVNDDEYIKLLKKALERQKALTSKAIAKLKIQPEIIYCKDCANNPKFGVWFKCPMGNLTDLQRDGIYCSFAQRRTDGN